MIEDTKYNSDWNGDAAEQYIASLLQEEIPAASLEKEHRVRQKKTNQAFAYGGASKRKFVIELTNWGTSPEERRAPDYELGAQVGPRRDRLRELAGKYWGPATIDDAKPQSVIFMSKGSDASREMRVPFSMWVSEPKYFYNPERPAATAGKSLFFEVKQVIRLNADKGALSKKNVYRADNWRTLIGGFEGAIDGHRGVIDKYVEYDYLGFDMQLPFNYRQLDDLNVAGPQYAKIRPEYNFYIRDYEEMLRFGDGLNMPEPAFPNLYALMLEKLNEVSNPVFVDHISLGGSLKDGDSTISAARKSKLDIKKHAGQYFDLYGRQFSKALSSDSLEGGAVPPVRQTMNKFKNIVVPLENVDLLKEISDKKELFPMFVDIEFSTDKMTEFAQMLSDTMLTNDFMWSMVKDVASSSGFETVDFMESVETSTTSIREDGTSTVSRDSRTYPTKRRVWDVMTWLKNSSLVDFDTGEAKPPVTSAAAQAMAISNSVFLDDGSIKDNLMVPPQMKFFKSLMGVVFVGKLKTFLKDRMRTYNEIIEGHPSHSETVLYRIEKTLASNNGTAIGKPIQNFWFPNTNQIDVLNMVDTQVKYGKRYAYRIYAYQLVVNTKYHYSSSKVWDDGAAVLVNLKPEVLLIEQEIFIDDQMIMDDPPVPPEIEIVPYFGNGHKLLFNLKSAVGEYHLNPVALDRDDAEQHMRLRISQKVRRDDPLRFKGDDPVGREGNFEIYRTETHPKSWADFGGHLLTGVSNNIASTGEFVDTIGSNKKYYYICRVIDAHGHISNPTDIWEVELVNDEGSIYMKKRIVDFAPREPRNPSKGMRRLLQIQAAPEQTFIGGISDDVESALQVKNVKLGERLEAPWGRKFKFRLVSKKTGKKIDLNVDFKTSMDRRSTLK